MTERWLWTQKQDIGPGPRHFHAMAYDTSRKRVVLFGGSTEDEGTWEWDGSVWTQVADMGPSPRQSTAVAYDGTRKRLVLFGGGEEYPGALSDTWEWDGGEWTQVADIGPAARYGHALAYDAARARIVLHGGAQGTSGNHKIFQDTWEWNGTEWQQIDDTGPVRSYPGMVFDTSKNCLWLFGGMANLDPETPLGDTWELSDTSWTKRQDMGPTPTANPKMVYAGSRTILFGGDELDQPGDTWEWNGILWTKRQNMGPIMRGGHALAYDSDRDRVVLFGGMLTNSHGVNIEMGDTWELSILSAG
jgi:hypothetical protein